MAHVIHFPHPHLPHLRRTPHLQHRARASSVRAPSWSWGRSLVGLLIGLAFGSLVGQPLLGLSVGLVSGGIIGPPEVRGHA
jgi:hypothetical protein